SNAGPHVYLENEPGLRQHHSTCGPSQGSWWVGFQGRAGGPPLGLPAPQDHHGVALRTSTRAKSDWVSVKLLLPHCGALNSFSLELGATNTSGGAACRRWRAIWMFTSDFQGQMGPKSKTLTGTQSDLQTAHLMLYSWWSSDRFLVAADETSSRSFA